MHDINNNNTTIREKEWKIEERQSESEIEREKKQKRKSPKKRSALFCWAYIVNARADWMYKCVNAMHTLCWMGWLLLTSVYICIKYI